jgi:hypothetical protein
MIRKTAYELRDGTLFTSHRRASEEATKRYGARVTALAHKFAKLEKYMERSAFIDSEEFRGMAADLLDHFADLETKNDFDAD